MQKNFFEETFKNLPTLYMTKEITIYFIAKELNLSPAKISRALKDNKNVNKITKKKIQDKVKKLGYRHNSFASNLRKQKHIPLV